MKKNKILALSLSLLLVMTCYFVPQKIVFADDLETPVNDDIPPEPYICDDCNSLIFLTCAHETIYDGTSSHGSCSVTYYKSRSYYYCSYCGFFQYLMTPSGSYAYHDCIQRHSSCGKGRYKVCPI